MVASMAGSLSIAVMLQLQINLAIDIPLDLVFAVLGKERWEFSRDTCERWVAILPCHGIWGFQPMTVTEKR